MDADLKYVKKMRWLREMLRSGEARELLVREHLSTEEIGQLIGVSQSSAWAYLNGQQVPRRRPALRLVWLLENLPESSHE